MHPIIKKAKQWLLYSQKYRDFIENLELVRLTRADFQDIKLKENIFTAYRDIFGHGDGDWGEFARCIKCQKIYSIEELYGLELYVNLSDLPQDLPESPCCRTTMLHFHEQDALNLKFNSFLSNDNGVVYILKDASCERIVGMIVGSIDKMSSIWERFIKVKLTPSDLNFPEANLLSRQVVYIDELGIIKSHRKGAVPLFTQLGTFLKEIKKLGGAEDIIFWTSKGSKLYKLIQQLPYRTILEDHQSPPQVVAAIPFKKAYRKVMLAHTLYT
jgi:hypothetical protein